MARKRLTPHQRETLERLTRSWYRGSSCHQLDGARWVLVTRRGHEGFGSLAAVHHLVAKGYAHRTVRYGPRGGDLEYVRPFATPVQALTAELDRATFAVLGGEVAELSPEAMGRRHQEQREAATRLAGELGYTHPELAPGVVHGATMESRVRVRASERWQQWLAKRPEAVSRMLSY